MSLWQRNILAVSLIAVAITSCSGERMDIANKAALPSIGDVPSEAWHKLSQKKIFFGHQSVGQNIIDGIKDVMKEQPEIKLNIIETNDPKDFDAPALLHSPIGRNMDPISKCDAFAEYMQGELGQKVDFACFKFCYIDILDSTDVDNVFSGYKSSVSLAKKSSPAVTIIHVTTPLRVVQTGPRAWIKKILGRPIGGYNDNIKREQFNSLIREEYLGREPVLDLAAIESISPDGSRVTFEKDGRSYPALVLKYTDDGGHLNELGRKRIAEQVLIFLANLANK